MEKHSPNQIETFDQSNALNIFCGMRNIKHDIKSMAKIKILQKSTVESCVCVSKKMYLSDLLDTVKPLYSRHILLADIFTNSILNISLKKLSFSGYFSRY